MRYIKGALAGGVMFIVAFALVLILMTRHSAPSLPPPPANAASSEVGFDLQSEWVDISLWPPLAVGAAAFAAGFYWMVKRPRNRGAE